MQKGKHDFLKRAKKRLLAGILAATMAFTVVPTNVFAVEGVDSQKSDSQMSDGQNAETPKEETPKEETPKEETPKEETPAAEPALNAAVATWADVAVKALDGTDYSISGDTYTIKTAKGLAWFANEVNVNGNDFTGKTVVLANNIDLNPAAELVKDYSKNITVTNSWTAIGSNTNPFTGTFDGAGFTVSGVKIKNTATYQGLFGVVDSTATVKNVGVINTDITGGTEVGGVVGENYGTVTNCYNTGVVTGTGTGSSHSVGGVVGENYGTVTNCYNTATVKGTNNAGGVVGYNDSIVEKCYYLKSGSLLGIGSTTTDVEANTLGMTDANMKDGTLLTNLNTNLDAIEDPTLYTWGAVANSYPILTDVPWVAKTPNTWAEVAANVKTDGTDYEWNKENTVVNIKTPTGLAWFVNQVNTGANVFANTTVVLANNIDLNPAAELVKDYSKNITVTNSWMPIGETTNKFAGTFDGAGHTVSGVKINSTEEKAHKGLFGYISDVAVVKNLGVIDSTITANGIASGVVAINEGTVINCYNAGTVNAISYAGGVVGYNYGGKVTNCYNTGTVTGTDFLGAVVGINDGGKVTNCYNTGTVNATGILIGGVVGCNLAGTVTNCYNTGTLTGATVGGVVGSNENGTVTNCYNTGAVTGTNGYFVGGVVGSNENGTVTNCYNTCNVIGGTGTKVGGVIGNDKNATVTKCYYLKSEGLFGIGGKTTDDNAKTLGMTGTEMKDVAFVTTLNDNLDAIADIALYTWGAGTAPDGYPILTDILWAAKNPTNITNAIISPIPDQTYTGKVLEPTLTVTNGTTKLKLGTDYTVEYTNNINVGTATAKVSGKGNYTGTIAKTFAIIKAAEKPADPTPSKPENSSTAKPATPSTGDSSPLAAVAGMMLLGLAGIAGLVWKKKQDR